MKAELVRTEHLQSDIFSIFFSKPARFRFTAGQFTEIVLPHDNADDRGIKRWFTISSSPSDELIAITTRFASEHGSSFKKVHATIVVSEPSDSWGGERGRLTATKILGLEKPSDETLFYLSGPEPMLEALTQDLQSHAVSTRQIVTDFFPGYREL
jgi:ferredoxin-NADP reductase